MLSTSSISYHSENFEMNEDWIHNIRNQAMLKNERIKIKQNKVAEIFCFLFVFFFTMQRRVYFHRMCNWEAVTHCLHADRRTKFVLHEINMNVVELSWHCGEWLLLFFLLLFLLQHLFRLHYHFQHWLVLPPSLPSPPLLHHCHLHHHWSEYKTDKNHIIAN